MTPFAAHLKAIVHADGRTVSRLAHENGLAVSTVHGWLSGHRFPDTAAVASLLAALHLPPGHATTWKLHREAVQK